MRPFLGRLAPLETQAFAAATYRPPSKRKRAVWNACQLCRGGACGELVAARRAYRNVRPSKAEIAGKPRARDSDEDYIDETHELTRNLWGPASVGWINSTRNSLVAPVPNGAPSNSRHVHERALDHQQSFSWRESRLREQQSESYKIGEKLESSEDKSLNFAASSHFDVGQDVDDDNFEKAEKKQYDAWELLEAQEDYGDRDANIPGNGVDMMAEVDAFETTYKPMQSQTPKENMRQQYILSFQEEIEKSLQGRQPDRLLRALVAASCNKTYMHSVPNTTFTEILSLLRPEHLTKSLVLAHAELSAASVEQMGIAPVRQIFKDYLEAMLDNLARRKKADKSLSVVDYAICLDMARGTGSRRLARSFWQAMEKDGVTPNTTCYNHYLAAIVWNEVDAHSRYKVRVTDFHMSARSKKRLGEGFTGYRVLEGGIKEQVMQVFDEMLKSEAVAEEDTFCTVIAGLAREGDIEAVKNVLLRVWEIDVNNVMTSDKAPRIGTTKFGGTSPLYPTKRLLFTVAHAFGMNNDIPAALRVLDTISCQYNVPITIDVWEHLFEWTFVLSAPRTKNDFKTGMLPLQSVQSLWDTMIGEPYNVRPTLSMYNRLIKNLSLRERPRDMLLRMEEARKFVEQHEKTTQTLFKQLEEMVEQRNLGWPLVQRREYERMDLLRRRNRYWMKRWLRLLLANMSTWQRVDADGVWGTAIIPRLILGAYRRWLPSVVQYEMASGWVRLRLRTHEEIVKQQQEKKDLGRQSAMVMDAIPRHLGDQWTTRIFFPRRLEQHDLQQGRDGSDLRQPAIALIDGDRETPRQRAARLHRIKTYMDNYGA